MPDHHLYRNDYDRAVDVAPGITLLHYPAGTARPGWAVRHACPGVHHDNPTEPGERIVIAPSCAGHEVRCENPLTLYPSILCNGSAHPCGLHGFVTDGEWRDAGTPPATMAHVRGDTQ